MRSGDAREDVRRRCRRRRRLWRRRCRRRRWRLLQFVANSQPTNERTNCRRRCRYAVPSQPVPRERCVGSLTKFKSTKSELSHEQRLLLQHDVCVLVCETELN